jgi:hypothetical protein
MIHTRHLLMHVYPVRGNGVWQWNLDQILARLHLFNGSKTIAVAVDETTDSIQTVRAHAYIPESLWFDFENDPTLREVVSHNHLWNRVPHQPGHATFYCHAKGVTHPLESAYNAWAKLLYEANLDYWPWVDAWLLTHPIAGALRKEVAWPVPEHRVSPWHYSGAFYWVRNDALVGRDWRKIDQFRCGVETWPSRLFTLDEAGVLFFRGGDFNMADFAWVNRIQGEWTEWQSLRQNYHAVGPPSNLLPPNSSKG